MTKLTRLFLQSAIAILFFVSSANARVISFEDNTKYWPGWNYGNQGFGLADDDLDVIGNPNFTGGTVEINDKGFLSKITIQQKSENNPWYGLLSPGDLFINSNARDKDSWDYMVDLTSWTVSGANTPDPGEGYYNLYSISAPLGNKNYNPGYILSGSDNTGGWSGYVIRDGHPVAWGGDRTDTGMEVGFSGWHDKYDEFWTFIFPQEAIYLGDQFTIAWQPNCANDVLFEKMANPVPEPATLLLFGSGILGLAGILRKSRKEDDEPKNEGNTLAL